MSTIYVIILKNLGGIMIKNLEELKNWSKYSNSTKQNLQIAQTKNLDAIGFLMTKEYNPNEVISFLQTLADPSLIGEIYAKDFWQLRSNQRIRGIVSQIEPLMDDKYTAHAAISLPTSFSGIQFPLVTNYSSNSIYVGNETVCPRFEKLIKLFSEKIGANLNFKFVSTNDKYFAKTKHGFDIFNKLSINSTYSLNENDKIVVVASLVANNMLEEYKSNDKKYYAQLYKGFSKSEISKIENVINDVLTLSIMRATDIGKPDVAYKIDEALKLQIANDIALIATYGNNTTKIIAEITEKVAKNIATKLDFTTDRIADNMKNMGFKYSNEPKNVLEALYNCSNLEKSYNIEISSPKEIVNPEADKSETVKKSKRVMHALTGPALLAGITNLKQELPGIFDSFIITDKDKIKITGTKNAIVSPVQSLIFVLKKKNKLNLFAPVVMKYESEKEKTINKVIDRFIEQREEDYGKSYKRRLNDILNEEYPNKDGKKSRSAAIVRRIINDNIKEANEMAKATKKQDDGGKE